MCPQSTQEKGLMSTAEPVKAVSYTNEALGSEQAKSISRYGWCAQILRATTPNILPLLTTLVQIQLPLPNMQSVLLHLLAALPAILAAPVTSKHPKRQEVANPIPGSWIVRLDPNAVVAQSVDVAAAEVGINTTYSYTFPGFKGFSFEGTEEDVEALLEAMPNVEFVEPDSVVSISALTTQSNAPWGLGRISHRSRGSTSYIYDSTAGSGTYSYIIDTGINTGHQDFGGKYSV